MSKARIEVEEDGTLFYVPEKTFRAFVTDGPNLQARGKTKEEAIENLENAIMTSYKEIADLARPIMWKRDEEKRQRGFPHPDYGDLHAIEEWGDRDPDGSYYLADATHYFPGLDWNERTEKHTHVMFFAK